MISRLRCSVSSNAHAISILRLGLFVLPLTSGCYHHATERFERWYELQPPPSTQAVERFRTLHPSTPVTTTQPNSWNKIEVGMTRGMVRALVGQRMVEGSSDAAKLIQDQTPFFDERHVRLYSESSTGADSDVLSAIIVRSVVRRWRGATEWP